jgi:hypothetical protein
MTLTHSWIISKQIEQLSISAILFFATAAESAACFDSSATITISDSSRRSAPLSLSATATAARELDGS